ncbi:MAG: DNA polymerase III subunit delta [Lachnospiraceae bacterium]|nr:DNA polymerase III subunit delta [Candidatus Colinaster scatohippi]
MQTIKQDIANKTFKQIYLLYGEEAYLRVQYKNNLKDALVPEDDTMNFAYYEGKDINIPELIDLAETLPFFADRRVIFLENTGLVKDGCDELAAYIDSGIPESTVFVITEMNVDKRTKLFKAIAKAGKCVEFTKQTDDTLKRWIVSKVKKENKMITNGTIDVFLEMVGTDMLCISNELDKLFAYTLNKEQITVSDVKEVCTVQLVNRIFEMIGMIGLRKKTEAIEMYHDLLALKETPFGMLALIERQFNIMLQMADLMERGIPFDTIAKKVGLSTYIAKKYVPQIKCFTKDEMKRVLNACAEVDYGVKTGDIKAELGVELLIIESCIQ